ncbi:MAG: NAD-dependent epimerase/dehydratase family protein [Betaproteobacteria bacterium]|nr:NAD-dependent epimerase/dehydratase family protein [Betaproteobacteria bacterium]NBP44799.1 NAD-dependent epimerase/dehydratase family protein [Betaproteobacteria bacterium]
MPSNLSPLGALPSRFRKPRLLVVGGGDVAQRMAKDLAGRWRMMVLVRRPEQAAHWRKLGGVPLQGDLDQPATLRRLAGLAHRVIHLAPPPTSGQSDPRSQHLVQALSLRTPPASLVYASTTGVYGDARGDVVRETRSLNPMSDRAVRRVHAEQQLRRWGKRAAVAVSVFRIPGIHAPDREGSLRDRLLRLAPVLVPQDDVHTNHIHADDLARILHWALWGAGPQRCYNVNDETRLPMGEALTQLAQHLGLAPPPRLTWAQAKDSLSPMVLSFWRESRQVDATRLTSEWPWRLRYPRLVDAYSPQA